ncbi:MAG: beta-propeller fold lactonase family protein [Phycisphaeraceae bacterium]|nr:beta-propeller fold lactonase family protein [Phycisphaeraceae bacterium]
MSHAHTRPAAITAAILSLTALCGAALGQAAFPAVFVANNGNLRGSVSSLAVNPDTGDLTLIQDLVIGERLSSQPSIPGTNAYSISITPDGAFLATTHTTSSTTVEQVTIVAVAPDGTLSIARIFDTPDSPLDCAWLSNDLLAVTKTNLSVTNEVIVYRYDREDGIVTLIDRKPAGVFCSNITTSPDRQFLFANDSSGLAIRVFRVNANGTLTQVTMTGTGAYPLGMGVTPDGLRLFAGGGISSGGRAIIGYTFDPDNPGLTPLSPTPFDGLVSNPKEVIASPGGEFLAVGYSDGGVRMFRYDDEDGLLINIPPALIVGGRGELGNLATMRLHSGREVLLMADRDSPGGRGVISATITPTGELVQNGPKVDTGGIAPNDLAAWVPPSDTCIADFNGDGGVDGQDVEAFFLAWEVGESAADVNQDGGVDGQDVEIFFLAWESGEC